MDEDVHFLGVEDVMTVHLHALAFHGGLEGLRDGASLESAVMRPKNLHRYDPAADLFQLAASLASGISGNHPFLDGNKRTAVASAMLFLIENGVENFAGHISYTDACTLLSSEEEFARILRLRSQQAQEDGQQ
jgi:death-on-curing protein